MKIYTKSIGFTFLMSDFKSKMKSNIFNTKELEIEIDDFKNTISENRITNKDNDKKLKEVLGKINEAKEKKEDLLGKRYSILKIINLYF